MLDRLKYLGFKEITQWEVKDENIRLASLDWSDQSGWLYAFAVGEEVKYVGRTTRVLRSRMDDYRDNQTEQPQRLRVEIIAELREGRSVSIYGLPEADRSKLESEEKRLRDELSPPWNRM